MRNDRLDPNAGWTPGSKGEGNRASALWGKRTSGLAGVVVLVLALALAAPMTALAKNPHRITALPTVPSSLLQQAQANPTGVFNVIVTGNRDFSSGQIAKALRAVFGKSKDARLRIRREFRVINGTSATLTGAQIVMLSQISGIASIVPDVPVAKPRLSSGDVPNLTNAQIWPQVVKVAGSLADGSANAPTIAIVDSGVDSSLPQFAGRLLGQVNLYSGTGPNSAGDGRGHGTGVAAIAAGGAADHAGAAPGAKIVSLDVLDDSGTGTEGDAIAAADWILQHKDDYNIKVANFSLNAGSQTSFQNDPLDKAVEKLWLSGVTVVVAAGNYGTGSTPSGVLAAPANDPFVITVGASDSNSTVDPSDDFNAPFSAWGRTLDGFAKPELGAPGRPVLVPIATGSTMIQEHPERQVAPGYMWLSGTSFAAPVVSGAVADILAVHPDWTPDQVKGALMLSAKPYSAVAPQFSLGVGIVDAAAAAAVPAPPNPNAALEKFVVRDPNGGPTPVFDVASWAEAATANASWAEASWAEASWAEASWAEASWAEASWAEASWAEASWAEASWAEASWAEGTLATASWFE